ncbi:YheC/YheD family protein [Bacillus suaedaesalsae]|uniref:YheC/YheD family protein n=1 Tax=Bacillus suaedaesalsae TaxID=2810349 RepID=A0ABS2DH82_9BACI|nr:YheC/YheD family protein [Bacillus suaedaesalsae]MBM6617776.1 YheC/YheD family protein [Bacillus suaedaesalsae]
MSTSFFQTNNEHITWGEHLPFRSSPLSFFPLVGILAGTSTQKAFLGNEAAFKRIQLTLQRAGGLSFVFTPSTYSSEKILGYVYDFQNECWRSYRFPLPSVVYNRVPLRKMEQTKQFLNLKNFLNTCNIPFFNDCFFHKDEVFTILCSNENLLPFLPVTCDLDSIMTFHDMIQQFQSVYLKPCKGKRGKGIVVVKKNDDDSWDIETIDTKLKIHSDIELINGWIQPMLDKDYIVQQFVAPLNWNGSRFDYRVLVHRKNETDFVMSGIGVRQSGHQQVTTHVPAGGKILSFSQLPFKEDKRTLNFLASEIGKTLTNQYANIGEFSMDVGKGKNGDLYIFEVNSKPMVFDEDHIRRKGLKNLIELFIFFSKQNGEK